MTKYFVDAKAPGNEELVRILRKCFEQGQVAFELPRGEKLEYDPEYQLWGIRQELLDTEGPYWYFDEEGGQKIKTGLIVHTFDDLPYEPGVAPYLGKYRDDVRGISAHADIVLTDWGTAIRITVAAPPEDLEQYYAEIRSRQVTPRTWLQPIPSDYRPTTLQTPPGNNR